MAINAKDRFDALPPERKAKILARAEKLVAEEKARIKKRKERKKK